LKEAVIQVPLNTPLIQVDAALGPMTQEKQKPFNCDKCGQGFGVKFNLKRHIELKHKDHSTKYMKHIKKDGKYVCKCCEKTYRHPSDLKKHYRTGHTEIELKKAGVDTDKAIMYTRKTITQHGPKT